MTLTPDQIQEAQDLISAHDSLRWNVARNSHRTIGLYAIDDDQKTTQPRLPPPIGHQVMILSLSLVEARLRELGVTVETRLEHDCFTCGGSGKRDMS